ncbi:hypothetical protein ACJJTC_018230 [Scirpophaga incertulas]
MDNYIERNRKRNENSGESSKGTVEKRKKYRKYDDQYLDFGFTYITKGNIEHPQCVVCHQVLAAESMLPNKLKRHLETTHSHLRGGTGGASRTVCGGPVPDSRSTPALLTGGKDEIFQENNKNGEILLEEASSDNRALSECSRPHQG